VSLEDRAKAGPISEADELRAALGRSQRELARQKLRTDALVAATIDAAKDATLAMGPVSPVTPPPKDRRKVRAEHALIHATDWQGSKVTEDYNSRVMRERVMLLAHKVIRITEVQRHDHPVPSATVMFGGDMVEGLFNYPTQPYEIDATLFEQYVTVSRLMVDFLRELLTCFERVDVIGEYGNHGRIGSKRDAVPRSDNVDRMCYALARALLGDEPRIAWEDSAEDVQRVEIGNYRALLIHGDEIGRGGFASPMTIVRHADRWRSGSYPWEFRDLFVGHYHNHSEWSMANGQGTVYQTGSTESSNRYARETMAASAIPSQRLHFVDPDKGRTTAQYKVLLDD
jgi:hypothetical protein